jgi:anhydro-N-acetylmuramic acid kinase
MALYIGVMSGTSLDGIDVALVDYDEQHNSLQLIDAKTYDFPNDLEQRLTNIITQRHIGLEELGQVDIALGHLISESVNSLLSEQTERVVQDIIAIGSHGQTVFHSPNNPYPFSMQIGNGNVIAELTGITTIVDFRQRDMTLSGQGAPLVPAFHQEIFSTDSNRAILNIGGISNVTFLAKDEGQPLLGFDTGPGNTLMNAWIQRHHGQRYDRDGIWAKSGNLNQPLLDLLLAEPYFRQPIPKSTGREVFNLDWLDTKIGHLCENVSPEDVQATLLEFTSQTIANAIRDFLPPVDDVLLCGGGAHNTALVAALTEKLSPIRIETTEKHGLHPDWVEAVAFAWLAHKTISHQKVDLTSITGSTAPTILGAVYWSNERS